MGHATGVRFGAAALIAVFAVLVAVACEPTPPPDLGQGWTQTERDDWYRITQGSRLLPYEWARHLEVKLPDGRTIKVFGDENVRSFGYLTEAQSKANPEGLPVGFALDKGSEEQKRGGCRQFPKMCRDGVLLQTWLGLNCSACHTNDIVHDGKTLRIDGGATLADFQGFFGQVLKALTATHDDDALFARFATNVLRSAASDEAKGALKAHLAELIAWEQKLHLQNGGDDVLQGGLGRLDAQGHILSKVATIVEAGDQLRDFESDAPASYPFIWNAPQHDKVQWNGIAPNKFEYKLGPQLKPTNLGALARNVGEVVGVFAHVDASREHIDNLGGFASSVQTVELIDIERRLMKLQSPAWPAAFGAIDPTLKAKGATLYRDNCLKCHALLARTDVRTPITAKMQSLDEADTDIWLACNTYLSTVKAGSLEGLKSLILFGDTIKPVDRAALMLNRTVASVIVGDRLELLESALKDVFARERNPKFLVAAAIVGEIEYLPGVDDPVKKQRAQKCLRDAGAANFEKLGLAYKARPLNGIWATAPYLHNGSVPSLYDLLLPGSVQNVIIRRSDGTIIAGAPPVGPTRPESFFVGNRTFDPKKVGFVYDKPVGFEFRVRTPDGKPVLGNYNSGHNYGTGFGDDDRWALVEYLKGL